MIIKHNKTITLICKQIAKIIMVNGTGTHKSQKSKEARSKHSFDRCEWEYLIS